MIKITNSVDNKKYSLSADKISIYNCGPTVYNHVHLGNLRPLVIFDVLYRYLLFIGKKVNFIHNITDIDDKIISAAKLNNTSELELSNKYYNAYLELFDIINIKRMFMPKVSQHIDDIINYVKRLIEIKAAYNVDGDVYFDLSKFKNYGCISHIDKDKLLDGIRKENKTNKNHNFDFVLWKKTEEGLSWKSPWNSHGRPGWHTECCTLINKYAGDHVTIHGGGVDLKFPHHENENAQHEALFHRSIADFWMHVGHVNINGQKMSKSLNNFILAKDVINKNNANGLRWFFYQTKYQNPINFTNNFFNDCCDEIKRITDVLSIAKTILMANMIDLSCNIHKISSNFQNWIEDDLNLPNAIDEIKHQIKLLNSAIRQTKQNNNLNNLKTTYLEIKNEFNILGINCDFYDHEQNIDLIKKWKKSLDEHDYDSADKYRKLLSIKHLL